MMKKNKWICTDSDQEQYGRRVNWLKFEFKDKYTPVSKIDLAKYSQQELESVITPYGYKFFNEDCHQWSLPDMLWIIAECVFERYYSEFPRLQIVVEVRGGVAYCDDPRVKIVDYDIRKRNDKIP